MGFGVCAAVSANDYDSGRRICRDSGLLTSFLEGRDGATEIAWVGGSHPCRGTADPSLLETWAPYSQQTDHREAQAQYCRGYSLAIAIVSVVGQAERRLCASSSAVWKLRGLALRVSYHVSGRMSSTHASSSHAPPVLARRQVHGGTTRSRGTARIHTPALSKSAPIGRAYRIGGRCRAS
jgi:hypothetical protein